MRSVAAIVAQALLSILGPLVGGLVSVVLFWWIGNLLYGAGVWPAGALFHVAALISLIGTPIWVLGSIVAIVGVGVSRLVRHDE